MKIELYKLGRRATGFAKPRCVPFAPETDELLTKLKYEHGLEPNSVIRKAVEAFLPDIIKAVRKHQKTSAA